MTRSTSRASARSIRIRTGGLVSRRPWNRRFVTPSAWKVCTTGTSRSRVADSAASPDIQKCACTRSGGSAANRAASSEPSRPTSGSSSSFGTGAAGPASRCSTSTPSAVRTRCRQLGRVPSRVDGDVVAGPGQRPGKRLDVDVLAPRVHTPDRSQRAGVFGHHGDPHRVTSLRSWFQSCRKRSSP